MGLGRVLAALSATAVGGFALHAGDAGFQGFMSQSDGSLQFADESDFTPHQDRIPNANQVCPHQVCPHPEVLVSSFGGVGTTSFMEELFTLQPPLMLNNPGDFDHLKHAPFPRLFKRTDMAAKMRGIKRIVYLHGGDLVKSILSLGHRGYLPVQAWKLRSDAVPAGLNRKDYPTLEDLVSWDGDYLQLEKHFESFWNQCQYDIAFLDITRKTEQVPALAQFLGVKPAELTKRLSPWSQTAPLSRRELAAHYNTTEAVVAGLTRKYGNLSGRLSALRTTTGLLIKRKRQGCNASGTGGGAALTGKAAA